jgi:hypothetical protein
MKTLKIFLLVFLIIAGINTISAQRQQRQDNYQMLQQKRVEFLITKMNLTVEESQKFWPLFNEYYEKRHELSIKNREQFGDHEHLSQGTEEDYLKALNGLFDFKEKQEQLFETYYKKYLQIISAEKVYLLYRYEEEFSKVLLQQLKDSPPKQKR